MVFISELSCLQSVGTLDELGAMGAARTRLHTLKDIDAAFTFLEGHYREPDEAAAVLEELHTPTAAKLAAARIRSRLAGTSPETLERLAHLVDTLNKSIALDRSIIEDLRPSTLGNLGLVATLEILAREFTARSGVQVRSALVPVKLVPAAELMVHRLVQEAITNISKYARARQVWFSPSFSIWR